MDPLLLVGIAAGAIAILLFTVIKLKWPAFVALLVVAVLTALAGGIPVQDVVPLMIEGMGGTLGSVALLVGLGAMLGGIIERTGGAEVIAHAAAEALGEKRLAQALLIASGLVAIPIFFDVAFIILVPIIFAFAKAAGHRGPVAIGMPVAVFMVFIHNTVPPHPGIVGSTTLLGEDLMGLVTLSGIVLAIPMCLLVHLVGKRVTSKVFTLTPEIAEKYAGTGAAELGGAGRGRRAAVGGNDGAAVDGASGSSHVAAASSLALAPADARTGDDFTGGGSTAVSSADGELAGRRPSAGLVIALILLPILLIALGTVGGLLLTEGSTAAHVVSFLGAPAFALLVATLAAMYLLGMMHGWGRAQISEVMDGALGPAAIVILVTGAGGVFAKVLTETGVGDAVSGLLLGAGVPILLLAFLVALAFKVAQGSGTVATLSAAGIVQGTVMGGDYSSMQVVLIILAIGLGSVSLSHINDSGFWIATKFLGLSVADGLRTWTVLTSALGFTSMLLLSLVWMVV
ncbi:MULTISPECIES: SLC13 family permease [Brachybacterium]|uniref:GntT/GntP/DsdX family permease n=1 Tax=Brachybacterium TaxID=43668 RepID=UPI0006B4B1DB|nr:MULTISPECIES: SLC13 family permease [Brachybacterium]GAP80082.1 gluconate permease [Brachybacterium sp. SW0106-09]